MQHSILAKLAQLLLGALLASTHLLAAPAQPITGPWKQIRLDTPPDAVWGINSELTQAVVYEGAPLAGEPTVVFAYLGRPARTLEPRPAMLLVHGGGGKAFQEWAQHWAERGYVALAMDLSGNSPSGRLPDGGPDQSDQVKFRNFSTAEIGEMWTYHAVAAVLRGHALLRSLPEVDPTRIGITGISWGGYLTCIVAGVDPELKVAVPVYGCGFLGENSYWSDRSLAGMKPESRQLWLQTFDPSRYLAGVRCPILFLNGTTDFAYPLDSYQKSYRLVPKNLRYVSVIPGLPHGHIWTFNEVDAFVGSVLNDGVALPKLTETRVKGNQLHATLHSDTRSQSASLHYTTDTGPWQARKWLAAPATLFDRTLFAELPPERPLTAFLALTDERGLRISSEHVVLGE